MTTSALAGPRAEQILPTRSMRALAIERAVTVRALHRQLASEVSDTASPGHVLALAVRCARALDRGGCPSELLPAATERLVRAALTTTG